MKTKRTEMTVPTIGFNVETITLCKGMDVTVWDVGGQDKFRPLWRHYFENTRGKYMYDTNVLAKQNISSSRLYISFIMCKSTNHVILYLVPIQSCDLLKGLALICLVLLLLWPLPKNIQLRFCNFSFAQKTMIYLQDLRKISLTSKTIKYFRFMKDYWVDCIG